MKAEPKALELALHYANERGTEPTWRGIVLGPEIAAAGGPASPTAGSTFGVNSLAEFLAHQAELRTFLDRLIALESPYAIEARQLAREIKDRAKPQFTGWAFSPVTERLFELWNTENTSFPEFLFFTLAQALKEVSFRDIHRCDACAKFFFEPSKRERKYCSNTCRSRVMVRQHRERLATAASLERSRPVPQTTPRQKPRRGGPK